MKRTTLLLHPECLAELRKLAAREGETISAIVDRFIRTGILQMKKKRKKGEVPVLPRFDLGRAKVNIADRDQLYEQMEGRDKS